MRYLIIGGDHPRHLHYINSIIESCNVVGVILETRENFLPKPPNEIEPKDRLNFIKHFENREKYELEYFGGDVKIPQCTILNVLESNLSDRNSVDFIRKIRPDIVFIFGSGMIKDPLYSVLPKLKINLHLGLSPRYRGSATLFWPFYFLEPNWAGSTFHLINEEPDAGEIIHQSVPQLVKGDTIHEVACKVVEKSAIDVKKIIDILDRNENLKLHKQIGTGRNFLTRDFIPQHLRVIYDLYNDDIVDAFLERKISPIGPKLISIDS